MSVRLAGRFVRLEQSTKFYELLELYNGDTHIQIEARRWGKIGARGQFKIEGSTGKSSFNELLASKLNRGYKETIKLHVFDYDLETVAATYAQFSSHIEDIRAALFCVPSEPLPVQAEPIKPTIDRSLDPMWGSW